jgi:hypothetical protein
MNLTRTLTLDTIHSILRSHARGAYQKDLLRGEEAWSGSTLKGNARSFAARYRASADALIQRLTSDGISAQRSTELIPVKEGTRRNVVGLSVELDDGSTLWISHRGTYVFGGEDNE